MSGDPDIESIIDEVCVLLQRRLYALRIRDSADSAFCSELATQLRVQLEAGAEVTVLVLARPGQAAAADGPTDVQQSAYSPDSICVHKM